METLSFVTGELKKVVDRAELVSIIDSLTEPVLCGYDLSDVDCSGLDFHGYTIRNVVFGQFSESRDARVPLARISFKDANLENVSFAQCELSRCNFDNATIQGGDFFYSVLHFCRFRDLLGYALDFRYSQIANCSLSTGTFVMCDFYMADFVGATAFINSHFKYCSLTSATFRGNCLNMDNLAASSITKGLGRGTCSETFAKLLAEERKDNYSIQDDYELYHTFYHLPNWNRGNPCGQFSELNIGEKEHDELISRISIANEARQFYSELSGTYTGKGYFKDSNRAYRMAKRKELEYYRLCAKKDFKDKNTISGIKCCLRCSGPLLSKILGYGYQWPIIVIWFIILVMGYSLYHYLKTKVLFVDSLTGSMNNAMGPNQEFIIRLNEFIGSLEPTIGTLLIGFLGFVIANKIRNNS